MSLLTASFNNFLSLVVTRTLTATPVGGLPVAGTVSTVLIDGSVQPVTGRALKDLPEGQSAQDVRLIFTEQTCYERDATHEPDVIAIPNIGRWPGGSFRVTKVEYFNVISDHYRITCERLEVP